MPWVADSADSCSLIRAIDRPQFAVHLDPVNLVASRACTMTRARSAKCFAHWARTSSPATPRTSPSPTRSQCTSPRYAGPRRAGYRTFFGPGPAGSRHAAHARAPAQGVRQRRHIARWPPGGFRSPEGGSLPGAGERLGHRRRTIRDAMVFSGSGTRMFTVHTHTIETIPPPALSPGVAHGRARLPVALRPCGKSDHPVEVCHDPAVYNSLSREKEEFVPLRPGGACTSAAPRCTTTPTGPRQDLCEHDTIVHTCATSSTGCCTSEHHRRRPHPGYGKGTA